jgi:DNA-binding response OmpR family regulator
MSEGTANLGRALEDGRARLLIVEDDLEAAGMMAEYLEGEGFAVDRAADGESGLELALRGSYDLVILDLMLPKRSGMDVLRGLRLESRVCVLILSARGDGVDRVRGLEAGADDYLGKPYMPQELAARVHAILRRAKRSGDAGGMAAPGPEIGDLSMDFGSRVVRVGGKTILLTATEFTLLARLAHKAGRLVTRDELSRAVLGRDYTPSDRSVDNLVSALRKKLGAPPDGLERIQAVRGMGYIYRLVRSEA